MTDYNENNIYLALKKVGLKKNDNIFCHSNLGFFGKLKGINDKNQLCKVFLKNIFKIIGKNGNLIVPTFSYSFFKSEKYINNITKSEMGIFSEWIRKQKNSKRSNDPNFSISCIGPKKNYFTETIENNTYSDDNFFGKFHRANGKVLNFNFPGSTIIHYYENKLKIKYRYNKKFYGISGTKKTEWLVFSKKISDRNTYHNPFPITNYIKKKKIAKYTNLGKGEILCINSLSFYNTIKKVLTKNPYFLTLKYKENK